MRQLKITKSITNRESASLDKYLQEIGREELITVEEEVELAQRIKKGTGKRSKSLRRPICASWFPSPSNTRTRGSACPT